jgi:hypothetical protein
MIDNSDSLPGEAGCRSLARLGSGICFVLCSVTVVGNVFVELVARIGCLVTISADGLSA